MAASDRYAPKRFSIWSIPGFTIRRNRLPLGNSILFFASLFVGLVFLSTLVIINLVLFMRWAALETYKWIMRRKTNVMKEAHEG